MSLEIVMEHIAYIGLGSNLDTPLMQVKTAVNELDLDVAIQVEEVSRFYKSTPLEINDVDIKHTQADYVNAVVKIATRYTPIELLDSLQSLELKHNRVKEYRWGPRSLDLDILLYDDVIFETERLTIPHVELVNRDFVLQPLSDINPELNIPKKGLLKQLLLNMTSNNLTLID